MPNWETDQDNDLVWKPVNTSGWEPGQDLQLENQTVCLVGKPIKGSR